MSVAIFVGINRHILNYSQMILAFGVSFKITAKNAGPVFWGPSFCSHELSFGGANQIQPPEAQEDIALPGATWGILSCGVGDDIANLANCPRKIR